MAKRATDVVVRAYDLGGFGDIAGAMRVASFIQRNGLVVKIAPSSSSALEKLRILNPDVDYSIGESENNRGIQVDVAGHYNDGRLSGQEIQVPHNYTEDMDHPNDRSEIVPIYLKSGLRAVRNRVPSQVSLQGFAPMFYRPFREWDLPKPHERDFRKQILQALRLGKKANASNGIERVLDKTDKVGFAHMSPGVAMDIFQHPYFIGVAEAQRTSKQKLAVGVFLGRELEDRVGANASSHNWNFVKSDGTTSEYNPRYPTLVCLGAQPQTITTGLFLSSNMPNLVTGDLSLSDALYGLIAMDGPAFYYETAPWKVPTFAELAKILGRTEKEVATIFCLGSNQVTLDKTSSNQSRNEYLEARILVSATFQDESTYKQYRERMQEALRVEIKRRFGQVPVQGNSQGGFYIPPGTPYLLEDATTTVIRALRENPDLFAETEEARRRIANGVPIVIGVKQDLIAGQPIPYPNQEIYLGSLLAESIPKFPTISLSSYLEEFIPKKQTPFQEIINNKEFLKIKYIPKKPKPGQIGYTHMFLESLEEKPEKLGTILPKLGQEISSEYFYPTSPGQIPNISLSSFK